MQKPSAGVWWSIGRVTKPGMFWKRGDLAYPPSPCVIRGRLSPCDAPFLWRLMGMTRILILPLLLSLRDVFEFDTRTALVKAGIGVTLSVGSLTSTFAS
ncbi:hypothetical protein QQF64_009212 [Cirrhinus molitorella]|uniref:Uncharacterized protein n=1 Tax=Cirrhinus molitorella TaxID=172907 RepID=A0ABR3M0I9_9TELE